MASTSTGHSKAPPNRESSRRPPNIANARLVAYNACREKAAAVCADALEQDTVNAVYAASVALAAARRAGEYRQLMEKLHDFDVLQLDELEIYGNALLHIQAMVSSRRSRATPSMHYASEATELRGMLLSYADTLVASRVFDEELFAPIKEGTGYRDLIEDLSSLHQVYQSTPGSMRGGAIKPRHVARALELVRLMEGEQASSLRTDPYFQELLVERRRLAVLLVEAHRQVRRALAYLRDAQGDVDWIVPPLTAPEASFEE